MLAVAGRGADALLLSAVDPRACTSRQQAGVLMRLSFPLLTPRACTSRQQAGVLMRSARQRLYISYLTTNSFSSRIPPLVDETDALPLISPSLYTLMMNSLLLLLSPSA